MPELGRIFFSKNPWPTGHAITKRQITIARLEGGLWLHLHLESGRYDEDGAGTDDGVGGDWTTPETWDKHKKCILSSTKWGDKGIRIAPADEPFDPSEMIGRRLHADPLPAHTVDTEEKAFGIYLLGQDAVADHVIAFREGTKAKTTTIEWTGKIALAESGGTKFRYGFRAELPNVPLSTFKVPKK